MLRLLEAKQRQQPNENGVEVGMPQVHPGVEVGMPRRHATLDPMYSLPPEMEPNLPAPLSPRSPYYNGVPFSPARAANAEGEVTGTNSYGGKTGGLVHHMKGRSLFWPGEGAYFGDYAEVGPGVDLNDPRVRQELFDFLNSK